MVPYDPRKCSSNMFANLLRVARSNRNLDVVCIQPALIDTLNAASKIPLAWLVRNCGGAGGWNEGFRRHRKWQSVLSILFDSTPWDWPCGWYFIPLVYSLGPWVLCLHRCYNKETRTFVPPLFRPILQYSAPICGHWLTTFSIRADIQVLILIVRPNDVLFSPSLLHFEIPPGCASWTMNAPTFPAPLAFADISIFFV